MVCGTRRVTSQEPTPGLGRERREEPREDSSPGLQPGMGWLLTALTPKQEGLLGEEEQGDFVGVSLLMSQPVLCFTVEKPRVQVTDLWLHAPVGR